MDAEWLCFGALAVVLDNQSLWWLLWFAMGGFWACWRLRKRHFWGNWLGNLQVFRLCICILHLSLVKALWSKYCAILKSHKDYPQFRLHPPFYKGNVGLGEKGEIGHLICVAIRIKQWCLHLLNAAHRNINAQFLCIRSWVREYLSKKKKVLSEGMASQVNYKNNKRKA